MFTIDHPTLFLSAAVRIINIAVPGRRPTIHPLRFGMFAGQDIKVSEEKARSANNRLFVKSPSLPDSEPPRRRRRLPAPLAGIETSSAPCSVGFAVLTDPGLPEAFIELRNFDTIG